MKLFLTILIAICQVGIVFIPIYKKELSDNRRNFPKNLTKAGIWMCTCLLLTLFSVIALYFVSEKEKEGQEANMIRQRNEDLKRDNIQQDKRNKEYINIISSSEKIISSQGLVIDTASKIIRYERDLRHANLKIARLQNETFKNLTGASRAPYVHFIPYTDNTGIFINVRNLSDYTLRNVSIELAISFHDMYRQVGPGMFAAPRGKEYRIDTILNLGDVPLAFRKFIYDYHGEKKYKKIMYTYTVRWLTGYYSGGFFAEVDDNGKFKVSGSQVSGHSKNIDLRKLLYVHQMPVPIAKSNYSP